MREMVRMAGPIVLINVGIQLMGVTDALMVGRLGGAAIAAVALGNFYFWNASVFGIGLLFALDPVVSQAFGAKDHEGVARGVQRGVMIAIMMAILVSLLLLPGEAILGALRQPGDVVPATAEYTRRRVIGVLPFFLFTVFRPTLQAMGPVRPILWFGLLHGRRDVGDDDCSAHHWLAAVAHRVNAMAQGSVAVGSHSPVVADWHTHWHAVVFRKFRLWIDRAVHGMDGHRITRGP